MFCQILLYIQVFSDLDLYLTLIIFNILKINILIADSFFNQIHHHVTVNICLCSVLALQ